MSGEIRPRFTTAPSSPTYINSAAECSVNPSVAAKPILSSQSLHFATIIVDAVYSGER